MASLLRLSCVRQALKSVIGLGSPVKVGTKDWRNGSSGMELLPSRVDAGRE